MTVAPMTVACPRCGKSTWDNRADKKNPKAPDFKCKDKTCVDEKGMGTGVWLKDLAKAVAAKVVEHSGGARLPYETEDTDEPDPATRNLAKLNALFALHWRCLNMAMKEGAHMTKKVGEVEGVGDDPMACSARAATMFIAATSAGLTVLPPVTPTKPRERQPGEEPE